jgi:hypothetical protein
VLNIVEDPINRSLSTTVVYKTARQGDRQNIQVFVIELTTLEEQIDLYTPE